MEQCSSFVIIFQNCGVRSSLSGRVIVPCVLVFVVV